MTKQIIKGLALLMTIIGFALSSAVAANGQTGEKLIAQIPFDFSVANKEFRSGEYYVGAIGAGGSALLIKSADLKNQMLALTNATGPAKGESMEARLVFHRYGNSYFLSQVWMAGELSGREVPKSRQERAVERELRSIASNRDSKNPLYEVVEVIATLR